MNKVNTHQDWLLVTKSTGSWYTLARADFSVVKARLRGKFKLTDKAKKITNPVAVGDWVKASAEDDGHYVITDIAPRSNYIIRKSVHKTAHGHIIAANLTQAVVIISMVSPRTSNGFIDRFLVCAESYRIPAMLVFNKSDLHDADVTEIVDDMCQTYTALGYSCLSTSATTLDGISGFKEALLGKTSLIAGHSGVGKSSLVNAIDAKLNIKTKEVSGFANKGVHTTTYAEMFRLGENTYIIDTPGIKEFGIMDLEEATLAHFFPEMRALLNTCKYNNCRHIQEPGCNVIAAVESGDIALSRYKSYLSILLDEDIHR